MAEVVRPGSRQAWERRIHLVCIAFSRSIRLELLAHPPLYVLTPGAVPGPPHAENDIAKQMIGTVTTYQGEEHGYLKGLQVKVVAVFKGTAAPDHDPDAGYGQ